MSDVTVKINFLGELRTLVKRRAIEVNVAEGSTVGALLQHLCENLGQAFIERIFDQDGSLFRCVSVFVNDNSIQSREGLDTRLSGGEVDILILPVYEGG